MYYGNICNSFIHLILYHIVALVNMKSWRTMWQPDFMTWLPISQLLSSEKAQFADANFPDGVGK